MGVHAEVWIAQRCSHHPIPHLHSQVRLQLASLVRPVVDRERDEALVGQRVPHAPRKAPEPQQLEVRAGVH
eukprot:scaffold141476_cov295-Phaeocystis_antarctica.AAC.1